MKYIKLFSILILFTGCINREINKESGVKHPALSTWELTQEKNKRLIGKRIEKSICPFVLDNGRAQGVLIVSINDCGSCVDRSFELLCKIGSVLDQKISVVTMDSLVNDFQCRIKQVIDPTERLKRKLNLFYTPSIVIFDDGYLVSILSIHSELNDKEKYLNESTDFINSILKLGY